jgi:hypothetical protein
MSDHHDDTEVPTAQEIQDAFDELERLGLIRKTGELRLGYPVYIATSQDWGTV